MEQWLKSPEVVNAVYKKAQINFDFENIRSYTKKFKARKMSSQYVEVKFNTPTEEEAEKISRAIVEVINSKAEALKKNSAEEVSFSVIGTDPVIVKDDSNLFLNLFIGFISGLVLGIFIVFWKEYFRENGEN